MTVSAETTESTGTREQWDTHRIARTAVVTGVVLLLAWIIDYVDRYAISMALPSIGEEFGLSKTMQGMLVTVFALAYMAVQLPAGLLADRFGGRALMLITLFAWSVFTALTGMAATVAVLLMMRTLFGLSQGCFPAAAFKALAQRTTPQRRAGLTGLMLSAAGIGSALGPLVVAPMLGALGWRSMFLWIAGCGLLLGILLWAVLPRPLPARLSASTPGSEPVSRRQVFASRPVWVLAALFFAMNVIMMGLTTWVPSYLRAQHVSLAETGVLTSIPMVGETVAVLFGGFLFNRFFVHRARWYLVGLGLLSAALLALMVLVGGTTGFSVFETLALIAHGLSYAAFMGLPMRILPPEHAGLGMGVVNFGGQLAAVLTPLWMGAVADAFSFTASFGLLAVGGLLAAGIALFLPKGDTSFGSGKTAASMGVRNES
ncbi:MFS transporter [Sciscionella sediminilitoris]|uniref:MFS transporter n=1 Tax=Sciscionella sediminilitoris TaxID=1445613 RepID=UPI0007C6C981|nr:MFS transporter [Sciscionella sp. SE31]